MDVLYRAISQHDPVILHKISLLAECLVDPFVKSVASFPLRRLPCLKGCVPMRDGLCPVIGMKNRFPLPPECLVQSQTCELQPAIINEINLTLGRSAPDMRRNRIDHVAKLSLAPAGSFRPLLNFLKSFFQLGSGFPLFGHIHDRADDLSDFTRLIPDRMSD